MEIAVYKVVQLCNLDVELSYLKMKATDALYLFIRLSCKNTLLQKLKSTRKPDQDATTIVVRTSNPAFYLYVCQYRAVIDTLYVSTYISVHTELLLLLFTTA